MSSFVGRETSFAILMSQSASTLLAYFHSNTNFLQKRKASNRFAEMQLTKCRSSTYSQNPASHMKDGGPIVYCQSCWWPWNLCNMIPWLDPRKPLIVRMISIIVHVTWCPNPRALTLLVWEYWIKFADTTSVTRLWKLIEYWHGTVRTRSWFRSALYRSSLTSEFFNRLFWILTSVALLCGVSATSACWMSCSTIALIHL